MRAWIDFTTPLERADRPVQRYRRAIAIALVLVLTTAPLAGAMHPGCDICPRDCPMHEHSHEYEGARDHPPAHLKCHNAPSAPAQERESRTGQPQFTRAACETHAIIAIALAPVILPDDAGWGVTARSTRSDQGNLSVRGRTGDPPDKPPPIPAA
ncbi:MAG: hypothetical protein AB7V27_12340 [Candidatus Binatia bacterium]